MSKEYKDFVYCNNCNAIQVTEQYSEKCINCREEGTLSWVNEDMQEIFSAIEQVIGFKS